MNHPPADDIAALFHHIDASSTLLQTRYQEFLPRASQATPAVAAPELAPPVVLPPHAAAASPATASARAPLPLAVLFARLSATVASSPWSGAV
jgi:hypothetical protein